MITPRATRVIRVPSLHAMRRAVVWLGRRDDPWQARRTAILVPTRSAAEALRSTFEHICLLDPEEPHTAFRALVSPVAHAAAETIDPALSSPSPRAFVPPLLVTRDDLLDVWHERYGPLPARLNDYEREALLGAAAAAVQARGVAPPFTIRPGLVAEILSLYDHLRRRHRTIEQFEQHAGLSLASSAEFDRGARRLVQQTTFLVHVFREYETRIAEAAKLDEHALRARLLGATSTAPITHLIITVADQAADACGLWPADFDLITRIHGLSAIDVVATDAVLDAGFMPRLLDALPEVDVVKLGVDAEPRPRLAVPSAMNRRHFVLRDREEELVHVGRWLRSAPPVAAGDDSEHLERAAIVFQRPLPYLYLGRTVFDAARIPFQAFDAVPLAAEPFAVAFDILLSVPLLDWTRAALVALLRSPLFGFADGEPLPAVDVSNFEQALRDADYLGSREQLDTCLSSIEMAARSSSREADQRLMPLCTLVRAIVGDLEPLAAPAPASQQLGTLAVFLDRFGRQTRDEAPDAERERRARQAVRGIIDALRAAYEQFGDRPVSLRDLAMTLRRWIEAHTFNPRAGRQGVHVVDAQAARFGNYDTVALVGLIEGEWQTGSSRSIFYPSSILSNLGWPKESDRQSASRAFFTDLLRLAGREVMVTSFTLEDDATVKPSTYLEDVEESQLERVAVTLTSDRVLIDDALSLDPVVPGAAEGEARLWLDARMRGIVTPAAASGTLSPRVAGTTVPRSYAVTRLENYLRCPFRYFAAQVLRLEEEQGDEIGLSALERGLVLHSVFEAFFDRWTLAGHGAIEVSNLDEARTLMAAVADDVLASVPPEDRMIERARLLGSPATSGFAEQVFRAEIARNRTVQERLLEYRLDGEYDVETTAGSRRVRLSGVVDRLDLMDDGTIWLYDYKLSRAPHHRTRLQLPVYARCAEQALVGYHGRSWSVTDAAYLALKDADGIAKGFNPSTRDRVVAEGLERLTTAIDGIEQGAFPVKPVEPFACNFCPYPAVCRKDDLGDD